MDKGVHAVQRAARQDAMHILSSLAHIAILKHVYILSLSVYLKGLSES